VRLIAKTQTPAASTKRRKGSLKRLPFLRFMELARSWIRAGAARVANTTLAGRGG